MELGKTFDIELNGIYQQATLIDIIEYQRDKYAIYTIMNDNDTCDIYLYTLCYYICCLLWRMYEMHPALSL